MTIDDTVKDILRAARDAKTLEECLALRQRATSELNTNRGAGFACLVAITNREDALLDAHRLDLVNEVP